MKVVRLVAIALTALVLVALVVKWATTSKLAPTAASNTPGPGQGPVAAAVPVSRIDMSPGAQAHAGEACKELVGNGGRLEEHRRGKTGLSPDRVLLYRWGDMDVSEQRSISGYQVSSFVDTLSGYSGNVVRTPFVCAVRDDFVVASLTFGQIQFPKR